MRQASKTKQQVVNRIRTQIDRATCSSDSEEDINSDDEQDSDREVNTEGALHPLVSQTQTDTTQSDTELSVRGDPVSSTGIKLKTGQAVTFAKGDECVPYRANVLGRAGKATGRHETW